MKLSVVVPCFNASTTLRDQLNALSRQSLPPWEVIVADNGSSDDSRRVALGFADRLPRLKVIDASARRGASAARNAGAAAATGDYLAFCDADDEVDDAWVENLARAFGAHDFVASRFDFERLNPGRRVTHEQQSGLQCCKYGFLPHAGGCGLGLPRSLHLAVGGFDESVRFLEDTDYCWKIQLRGTPLAFAADAVVHVRQRENPRQMLKQARTWACSEVQLYKRYRGVGLRGPNNLAALREWLRIPWFVFQAMRGRRSWHALAWRVGTRLGHLQGSLLFLTMIL
ncbi:MAG: glycosyltransferase family A protein [Pseudomonadales bacterium]